MTRTLASLIDERLGGGASTGAPDPAGGKVKVAAAKTSPTVIDDDPIKLAGVLDALVKSNYLVKVASSGVGTATETDEHKPTPSGTIDTRHTSRGTHHPALASHAAVAAAGKDTKARQDSPALKLALRHQPYADPATGQVLSRKTNHKDINAKLAGAKAELARRKGGGQ